MTTHSLLREARWWLGAASVGVAFASGVTAASAQVGERPTAPAAEIFAADISGIEGMVVDEAGRPLAGVAVSAEGAAINFATSDARGRFVFRALSPGTYQVTATLRGFGNSARQWVVVRTAKATSHTIQLRRTDVGHRAPETPRIVAASLGLGLDVADDGAQDAVELPAAPEDETTGGSSTALDESTDHGSLAWRLRHQRRSVLREETTRVTDFDYGIDRPVFDPSILLGAVESSARMAAAMFAALPLSGQVRFLTTSAFDSPGHLWSPNLAGADGVAHVAVESRSGDWTAQAALTQGDVASWMASGKYRVEPWSGHTLDAGVSYAAQRYAGANPAALAALTDGGRNVGTVSVSDVWTISRSARITSTLRYGRYDYLNTSNLFSPVVSVAFSPMASTWVRATVSQLMAAPGAEEFTVTRSADMWGPPQRTFSPIGGWAALRPERTRHVELGLEREVGTFLVGIRRVDQQIDDQMLTSFGQVAPANLPSDLRHYAVASVGQGDVHAWTVMVGRPVGSRFRGAVEYSSIDARFSPSVTGAAIVGSRGIAERLHDVTGSIEACVSESRTRVSAAYKLNTGFVRPDGDSLDRGPAGRFDVQVHQGLPVPGARAAEWELLVAVRNLFFDRASGASVLNELLVVRPPKRVLGGVSVKF